MSEFSQSQKQEILERDEHRCVLCGYGIREGETLYVDIFYPVGKGNSLDTVHGATFCSRHSPGLNGLTLADLITLGLNQLQSLAEFKQDQGMSDDVDRLRQNIPNVFRK